MYAVETMSTVLAKGRQRINSRETSELLQEALDHYGRDLGLRLVAVVPDKDGEQLFCFLSDGAAVGGTE